MTEHDGSWNDPPICWYKPTTKAAAADNYQCVLYKVYIYIWHTTMQHKDEENVISCHMVADKLIVAQRSPLGNGKCELHYHIHLYFC